MTYRVLNISNPPAPSSSPTDTLNTLIALSSLVATTKYRPSTVVSIFVTALLQPPMEFVHFDVRSFLLSAAAASPSFRFFDDGDDGGAGDAGAGVPPSTAFSGDCAFCGVAAVEDDG